MRLHLHLMILLSSVLLGFGLFAPALIITPGLGEMTPLIRVFRPDFGAVQRVSIFSGIGTLFEEGHTVIAVLILSFSILFPLWKLGVLWAAAEAKRRGEEPHELFHLSLKLGKYSMLDVLVLALIVISATGLPGSSDVAVGWGAYAFAASVILTLIVKV